MTLRTKARLCRVTTLAGATEIALFAVILFRAGRVLTMAGEVFGEAGRLVEGASAADVTGGWQALGGLGLGMLGGLGALTMVGVILALTAVCVLLLMTVLTGRGARRRYLASGKNTFTGDAVLKTLVHGPLAYACFKLMSLRMMILLFPGLLSGVSGVLCILSLVCRCKAETN